jgi:glycosyltransferase involved in cell wall biosynthesis
MLKISAVIPAHNEESTIGEIVQECARYRNEVLVVDDASSDMTCQVARAAGATVTRNRANLGIVRSTEIGLKLASQEVVVTLDADGQHDPYEIPSVVRPSLKTLLILSSEEENTVVLFQSKSYRRSLAFG